jgi:hypothetical protein
MILKNLYAINESQRHFHSTELGIDSRQYQSTCAGDALLRFDNYPYNIEYKCNSRGFRGPEWPDDVRELNDSIWCIGDSFTFGVGVPYEHTWPYLLQQKTSQRAINMAVNGVGNTWLVETASEVLNELTPSTMIFHWSYTHRRKKHLWDYDHYQNTTVEEDADLLISCIQQVESIKGSTKTIHSFIPKFHGDCDGLYDMISETFNDIKIIPYIVPIDYGRDNHHYDKLTAEKFVDNIIELL